MVMMTLQIQYDVAQLHSLLDADDLLLSTVV